MSRAYAACYGAAPSETTATKSVDRLSVFSFLWACQALVHQDFFDGWLYSGNPMGWLLTAFIVATMLFPRSLGLFSAFLTTSIAYNFEYWPFVANHILLESVINATILLAIGTTLYEQRITPMSREAMNERIFERFAPVVGVMIILMYTFIVITKLNWDFLSLEHSCINNFYIDVLNIFSFLPLPTGAWALKASLWLFIGIEIAIPLLLCFQKTRYLALLMALPFHLLLGIIGHRTFSGFIFALYGMIAAGSLVTLINSASQRPAPSQQKFLRSSLRILLASTAVFMAVIMWQGQSTPDFGMLYQMGDRWLGFKVWLIACLALGAIVVLAVVRSFLKGDSDAIPFFTAAPGYLWLMLGFVVLCGLSPYLGLKTETSFAMYSNLRTEGDWNNHVFMPALRLADYQSDLVEILETDHPQLQRAMASIPVSDRTQTPRSQYITYFEFRRIVSESNGDFFVKYSRNGEVLEYNCCDGASSHGGLATPAPLMIRKLLRFRPIYQGPNAYCQH